jgi:hypothetical protein
LPNSPSTATAARRRTRSISIGAPPNSASPRAITPPLLDEGRAGVAKDPAAAADELLSAVAADSGESIADLIGKTQNWSPATVKALESRLAAAGYYSGPINGKSGPALGPALRQWRLLGAPEKT